MKTHRLKQINSLLVPVIRENQIRSVGEALSVWLVVIDVEVYVLVITDAESMVKTKEVTVEIEISSNVKLFEQSRSPGAEQPTQVQVF